MGREIAVGIESASGGIENGSEGEIEMVTSGLKTVIRYSFMLTAIQCHSNREMV